MTTKKKKATPPFRLVAPRRCPRTIAMLEHLAEMAWRGECVGIAFVAILEGRHYARGIIGAARSKPEFVMGCLDRVKQELLRQAEQNDLS